VIYLRGRAREPTPSFSAVFFSLSRSLNSFAVTMLSVLRKRAADSLLRAYSTRASQIVFGEVRGVLG